MNEKTRPKEAVIYIVDDDPSFRKSLKRLVEALGFNVIEFDSGITFLEHFPLKRPSCLILDFNLPKMDGLTLQEELSIRGVNIPIIFITGHRDATRSVEARKNGAVDFLLKPFSAEEIEQAISQAVKLIDKHKSGIGA